MKNLFLLVVTFLAFNAYADIEYTSDAGSKATAAEIQRNRACFQELSKEGCGDPGADHAQFRSCLNNVYSRLSSHCKTMMSELYGSK